MGERVVVEVRVVEQLGMYEVGSEVEDDGRARCRGGDRRRAETYRRGGHRSGGRWMSEGSWR